MIQIGIGHTAHRPPGAYSSESQFPLIFLIIIVCGAQFDCCFLTSQLVDQLTVDANHRKTPDDFKDRSLVEVRSLPIQPGWFWFHPMTGDCWLQASHGTKKTVTGREKVTGRPQTLLSKPLTKGLSCTPAGIDWTNMRQKRSRQRQNSRSEANPRAMRGFLPLSGKGEAAQPIKRGRKTDRSFQRGKTFKEC